MEQVFAAATAAILPPRPTTITSSIHPFKAE
jgi:hypothetical protein